MGNVLQADGISQPEKGFSDINEADEHWLNVQTQALFDGGFVSEHYDDLPLFKGTVVDESKQDQTLTSPPGRGSGSDEGHRRNENLVGLLTKPSGVAACIDDLPELLGEDVLQGGAYSAATIARRRLLLRVHLALLRSLQRVKGETADGGTESDLRFLTSDENQKEGGGAEPSTVLAATSIRMSLAIARSFRGQPVGQEIVNELLQVLSSGSAAALAKSAPGGVEQETLAKVRAFAEEALDAPGGGGEAKASALAIMVALGLCQTSLGHVVPAIARLLAAPADGGANTALPDDVAQLLGRLAEREVDIDLETPTPGAEAGQFALKGGGVDAGAAHDDDAKEEDDAAGDTKEADEDGGTGAGAGGEAAAGRASGRGGESPSNTNAETDPPARNEGFAATATDGVYVFAWDAASDTVRKVGTGFHGTIAGNVYAIHRGVEASVRKAAIQQQQQASGADGPDGLPPPPVLERARSVRRTRVVTRFNVIRGDGALCRDGPSIDEASQVTTLPQGHTGEVLERTLYEGIPRLRVTEGWISLHLRGGNEDTVCTLAEETVTEVDSVPQGDGEDEDDGGAWLACVDGVLYFRSRNCFPNSCSPSQRGGVAALSTTSLKFVVNPATSMPALTTLAVPALLKEHANRRKREERRLRRQQEAGNGGGNDDDEDDVDEWELGEVENLATAAHGAAVFAVSGIDSFEGDVAATRMASNVLCDEGQRQAWTEEGETRLIFRNGDEQRVYVDLGRTCRRSDITSIGAIFCAEGDDSPVTTGCAVAVSATGGADDGSYVTWGDQGESPSTPAVFANPGNSEDAQAQLRARALPSEFRYIRFDFGRSESSDDHGSGVHHVRVDGRPRHKKRVARSDPAMCGDGRYLYLIAHAPLEESPSPANSGGGGGGGGGGVEESKDGGRTDAEPAEEVRGDAPAAEASQAKKKQQAPKTALEVSTFDPLDGMRCVSTVRLAWGGNNPGDGGAAAAAASESDPAPGGNAGFLTPEKFQRTTFVTNGSRLLCLVPAKDAIDEATEKECVYFAFDVPLCEGGAPAAGSSETIHLPGMSSSAKAQVSAASATSSAAWVDKTFVPSAMSYDARNNMLWGFDPCNREFCLWRNTGNLAPRFHRPQALVGRAAVCALDPSARLDAIDALSRGAGRKNEPMVVAATIMAHIDRLGVLYGPAPLAAPSADPEASNGDAIEITSAGAEDGDCCSIRVRGREVARRGKGLNVVVLDEDAGLHCRSSIALNTAENPSIFPALVAFIQSLEDGALVCVAVQGDANGHLGKEGADVLRLIGSEQIDALSQRDSFALIGRKGASAALGECRKARGNGKATLKIRLKPRVEPFAIDTSADSLSALARLVLDNAALATEPAADPLRRSVLLGAIRALSTNVYRLLIGAPESEIAPLQRGERGFPCRELQAGLLRVIDATPEKGDTVGEALISAFLGLFVTALDLFYPTSAERCELLVQYLGEYTAGTLSRSEAAVLDVLLRRTSKPAALAELLHGGDTNSGDLMAALLKIASTEGCRELDALAGRTGGGAAGPGDDASSAVGGAAVGMLKALALQVLSLAAQDIVTDDAKAPADATADEDSKDEADRLGEEKVGGAEESSAETARKAAHLVAVVTSLCDGARQLIDKAVAVSDVLSAKNGELHDDVDELLRGSIVGQLLPTMSNAVTMLMEDHGSKILPSLAPLVPTLEGVMSSLSKATQRVPRSKRVVKASASTTKVKKDVHDSAHPYLSNMNEHTEVCYKGATKITIVFHEETRTENGYDYLKFWKNADKTATWHPDVDKYTGRGGSDNWPGMNGRDPLVIEGDSFYLEWHTDGSGEDWGWRFTAEAEIKTTASSSAAHWAIELDQHLAACGSALASALIESSPWDAAREGQAAQWMTSDVITSNNAVAGPDGGDDGSMGADDAAFLESLIERPPGSAGEKLAVIMKRRVREDQGSIPAINRAVCATIAALLWHNGLVAEARAIATGNRSESDIPEALQKAWRAGQKMRQYFDYGDVAEAQRSARRARANTLPDAGGPDGLPPMPDSVPMLDRGPSVFRDAEESVLSQAADSVVERARFLFQTAPAVRAQEKGDLGAKKRWEALTKFTKSLSLQRQDSGKWASVVNQAKAAQDVKQVMEYRRRAAARLKKNKAASITDKVLRFAQSSAKVEHLVTVRALRNTRAEHRAAGLHLMRRLIESAGSPSSRTWLLASTVNALRSTKRDDLPGAHVHFLNCIEGCGARESGAVAAAFFEVLSEANKCLAPSDREAAPAAANESAEDRQSRYAVQRAALQACSLDYDLTDHAHLHAVGLARQVEPLITHADVGVRTTAAALFRILVQRCVALEGQDVLGSGIGGVEDGTPFMNELLVTMLRQLDRSANDVLSFPGGADPTPFEGSPGSSTRLMRGVVPLRRDELGLVCAHSPTGLRHSMSFWYKRPAADALDGPSASKPVADSDRVAPRVGSRVRRGPDWGANAEQDGSADGLGTVQTVEEGASGQLNVAVKWDSSAKEIFTYAWNAVLGEQADRPHVPETAPASETRRVYPINVVEEGSGGVLYTKGAQASLTDSEQQAVWSQFGLRLMDDGTLSFWTVFGEDATWRCPGYARLAADEWSHIAVVHAFSRLRLYVNGKLDSEVVVEPGLLNPGAEQDKASRVIESPHPYRDNMDEYWTVAVEGALSYKIVFDPKTRTERSYDFVKFFKDSSHQEVWGDEKYSGTDGPWPGLGSTPSLDIPASSFVVHFHSDGSNNDWGFKFVATAKMPAKETAEEEADTNLELNRGPFYFGTPSMRVVNTDLSATAPGFLSEVRLYATALSAGDVQAIAGSGHEALVGALSDQWRAVAELSLDKLVSAEAMCLGALGNIRRCLTGNDDGHIAANTEAFTRPEVVDLLFKLMTRCGSASLRLAAIRLAMNIFPHASPDLVGAQAAKNGAEGGFIAFLFNEIGRSLSIWTTGGSDMEAQDSAEMAQAIVAEQLQLLRTLAVATPWRDEFVASMLEALGTVPELLGHYTAEALRAATSGQTAFLPNNPQVSRLTTALAVIAGANSGLAVGSRVACRASDGNVDEGTVVQFTTAPRDFSHLDATAQKAEERRWEKLRGLGGAVVVSIDSEPGKTALLRACDVAVRPCPLSKALTATLLEADADGSRGGEIIGALGQLLAVDTSDRRPVLLPKIVEEDKVVEMETDHPYPDSADTFVPLEFPGAKEIVITFNEQCRTEPNCDYLRFYKTDAKTDFYGESQYHGRDGEQNWPSLQGRPDLVIPASSCVVHFHSDGSNTDWGYKFTARGHTVEKHVPPEVPPLVANCVLQQLRTLAVSALDALLDEKKFIPRCLPLVVPLVEAAVARPRVGACRSAPKPLMFETKHPYDHNVDRYIPVKMSGAQKLTITFDDMTMSENGCDYLRVYKDESHTEFWGESQYTGGINSGSSNWPGIHGRPPLVIPADHCEIYWHTDGSCNTWGWRLWVTPAHADKSLASETSEMLDCHAMAFSQALLERPGLPSYPEDTDKFETAEPPSTVPLELDDVRLLMDVGAAAADSKEDVEEKEEKSEEAAGGGDGDDDDDDGADGASAVNRLRQPTVWPRRFAVNTRDVPDGVAMRASPAADSEVFSTIGGDTDFIAFCESGNWLKVARDRSNESPDCADAAYGWICRREGDQIYVVPADEQASAGNSNEMITLPDEEEDGGDAAGDAANPVFSVQDPNSDSAADEDADFAPLAMDMVVGQAARLASAAHDVAQVRCTRHAQASVAKMVADWPSDAPFDEDAMGGFGRFVAFLKLAHSNDDSNTLKVLKSKILDLVELENRRGNLAVDSAVSKLVGYCTSQLKQAVSRSKHLPATKAILKTVESAHPYLDNTDQTWPVHIPGAKRIKVTFTSQSSTESGCDYVTIFSDEACNSPLGERYMGGRSGGPKIFAGVTRAALIVEGDRLWVKFHSDGSNTDWGFKLLAHGIMSEPTDEERAAFKATRDGLDDAAPDVGLACWLLELLSKQDVTAVNAGLYAASTLRTIRRFLAAQDRRSKHLVRAVHLLTAMLQETSRVTACPGSGTEIRKLAASLREQISTRYKQEEAENNKSQVLQAFVQCGVAAGEAAEAIRAQEESGERQSVGSRSVGSGSADNDDFGEFGRFWFDPDTCGRHLETANGRRSVRKGGSGVANDPTTAVAATTFGPGGSDHCWDVKLRRIVGRHARVGICLGGERLPTNGGGRLDGALGSFSETSGVASWGWGLGADGNAAVFGGAASAGAAFGPKFCEGDVITVLLDLAKGTLSFFRNSAFVGVAVGPAGSGAPIEAELGLGPYHPAVTLTDSGDMADLSASSVNHSELATAGGMALPWFDSVRSAVEMLTAFSQRRLPLKMLADEFAPTLRKHAQRVWSAESSHPFNNAPSTRTVTIAGAVALKVSFDSQTALGAKDVIRIVGGPESSEEGENGRVLVGLNGGLIDTVSTSTVSVGDKVVRGPSWDWGDQDGGAGCFGEVQEVIAWKGKQGSGVRVQWRDNNAFTGLYRWDFEGAFDLTVVGQTQKSQKPVVVKGDTVTVTVEPDDPMDPSTGRRQSAAAEAAAAEEKKQQPEEEAEADTAWLGSLRFNASERSGVVIPYTSDRELSGDFTLEAWVSPAAVGGSNNLPIIARGPEPRADELAQFWLGISGAGFRFTMQNAGMERGVVLAGGEARACGWTHVAATVCGATVTLYVGGVQVDTGDFAGPRLGAMDTHISVGRYAGDEFFDGHIVDVRVWNRARSVGEINAARTLRPLDSLQRLRRQNSSDAAAEEAKRSLPDEAFSSTGDGASLVAHLGGNEGSGPVVGGFAFDGCSWDNDRLAPNGEKSSSQSGGEAGWGFRWTVTPVFASPADFGTQPDLAAEWEEFVAVYQCVDARHDVSLVNYVNEVATKKSLDKNQLLRCSWCDIAPMSEDLVRYPVLKELCDGKGDGAGATGDGGEEEKKEEGGGKAVKPGADQKRLQARFGLLQSLNKVLADTVPLIDLCMTDRTWSLAYLLATCRGLVFRCFKTPVWDRAMAATEGSGSQFDLKLSRSRAAKHTRMGEQDHEGRWTCFGQAMRQMHVMPTASLRRVQKLYNCIFMGERSHDAGGPYRESYAMYASELQSSALPLLVRTPNGRHNVGHNRDRWLLNSGASTPHHLEMFVFFGKLMGIAIRTGEYLNLNLSSFVWKALCGQSVTMDDLEGVDSMLVQSMDSIRNIDQQGVTEEMFEDVVMETFVTLSTDDREVELKPGGKDEAVTWATRGEFADRTVAFRLQEFATQAEATRRGLAAMVPQRLLTLFTWEELELMVCGKPEVDIDLLESATEHSGCSRSDAHVGFFWQALREFGTEERQMFLKFTWGRARLPLNVDAFEQRFKLQNWNGSCRADDAFPVAHTCFFSLELPRYSTLEILKTKLRYAIHNCTAIDGDDTGVGMAAASMGWED